MKGKEVIDWIKENKFEDAEITAATKEEKQCGTFECFHCLHRALIWQSDFTFEDYGYDGDGIVQNLVCSNCGAEVEYRVSFSEEDE